MRATKGPEALIWLTKNILTSDICSQSHTLAYTIQIWAVCRSNLCGSNLWRPLHSASYHAIGRLRSQSMHTRLYYTYSYTTLR